MVMAGWILAVELRGALVQTVAAGPGPAAVVADGCLVDVNAAALQAGVGEGMGERAAVLRIPDLRRQPLTESMRAQVRTALRAGMAGLADVVRPSGERGAIAPFFLGIDARALDAPWADTCARLVPTAGWQLVGAAARTEWAAGCLLAAGQRGVAAVETVEAPGGRLHLGAWQTLPLEILDDVAPAMRERARRQGLRTLGQLAALGTVERRLLVGATWAARLVGEGEAGGVEDGRHEVWRAFEPALDDAVAVDGALAMLAGELAEGLARRGQGVRVVRLAVAGVCATGEIDETTRERTLLVPLPAGRLAGVARGLLWGRGGVGAVAGLRLGVEAGAMAWSQARMLGARLARPIGPLPDGGVPAAANVRRLRREARLALWDPLRAGRTDATAR